MNIVTRYISRDVPHETLQIYKLLRAGKYIVIVTLGFNKDEPNRWIPGTFKNKRVRKALKITKKNWKRITGGKISFETEDEVKEVIKRINLHLSNIIKEDTSC